jgi:hypothetical protein
MSTGIRLAHTWPHRHVWKMSGSILERKEAPVQLPVPISASSRNNNRWQAYTLLLLGMLFLVGAWLRLLNAYPVGELFFGSSMLAAAMFNTRRFLAVAWLTTLIGLAGFLIFGHILPGNQILAVHVMAIGLGILGIRWMARHGYISTDTMMPGLVIISVGIIEYLQAAHLTPAHFLSFALSLWLPGYGLLVLGLVCLVTSRRTHISTKR